jgi:hypothetical protein
MKALFLFKPIQYFFAIFNKGVPPSGSGFPLQILARKLAAGFPLQSLTHALYKRITPI